MNPIIKKIIAVLGSAFLLVLAYYGSYLPLKKSQAFIDALQKTSSIHSTQEFYDTFAVPLGITSPIGQEELVRNTANTTLNIIQQFTPSQADIIAALVSYLTAYYEPIFSYGKGMSFEQNLYVMGAINELSYVKTKNPNYLNAAHDYYERGRVLGPQRPQFLYGLFDVYRFKGDTAGVEKIGQQILSQWPNDTRTQDAMTEYFMTQVAPQVQDKK
ncbi:MAG: hypothetical protein Q7S28_03485 [bacterium]|nr:hypothetical protein [bacterium]